VGWNKGLTKETDERIKRQSEKLKGRSLGMTGKHHKEETIKKLREFCGHVSYLKGKTFQEVFGEEKAKKIKKQISGTCTGKRYTEHVFKLCEICGKIIDVYPSRSLQKFCSKRCASISQWKKQNRVRSLEWCQNIKKGLKKHFSKCSGHKPTYPKPYFVSELGHKVRSSLERDGLLILKRKGICYFYEKPYLVFVNDRKRFYYADCTLENNVVIEFKGYPFKQSIEKMVSFKSQYPQYMFVIVSYEGFEKYEDDVFPLFIKS